MRPHIAKLAKLMLSITGLNISNGVVSPSYTPASNWMMARSRARSLSSTGHYAAGCVTVTLLGALSLILLRGPAAEKRCDLSSYDPASTEALDLKRCKISTLPVAIAEFRRLKKLDLGFNALQALPALPPSLEVLFLLANGFEEVASLGLGSGFSGQSLRLTLALTWAQVQALARTLARA